MVFDLENQIKITPGTCLYSQAHYGLILSRVGHRQIVGQTDKADHYRTLATLCPNNTYTGSYSHMIQQKSRM